MGLIPNDAKCEIIGRSDHVVDDPLLWFFTHVQPCDATLLGASLFHGKVLNDFWSNDAIEQVADLMQRQDDRLKAHTRGKLHTR